ncbi:hypothetical protein K875_01790 [Mycobacterium [tuberculosis] TKK-01-0051]|uniref:Uncharacterized protein n=1 Tax=Mycobacterium [tuberculosis] TKK-01-0051 TaxID=1324261 RepID=A0A051U5F3_9MYCO|nr:hypothetical protein K875_01790 [Mycobacterium [tuberculosis] TKK-01-0051]
MTAIVGAACVGLVVLLAMGTYNLQWRLERSDYQRHFED